VWLRQIVDLLDALGDRPGHVVGNSFGGSMALALAIHHPERVDRLVLMGASASASS
jgi:2-hydroxymuconate-semialdehyde hydrolase